MRSTHGKTNMHLGGAIFAAALVLASCGGGGGGGGTGPSTGTPVVSAGPMTKGSLVLNGVRFEDTAANITGDDTPKTAADLDGGMMVKVRGTINDDGLTGRADEVEIENELRGRITAIGADFLVVLGTTVFVDGGTVYANVSGLAGLAANDNVEVHGPRDSTGAVRATRVEKLGGGAIQDELRGTVDSKDTPAGTFTLAGSATTFTYDGGTALPQGAFAVGDLVEVHLSGTYATRIEREDVEDDSRFRRGEGQEIEVEGYISGFAGPGDDAYFVGGQPVVTTSSTRYEGGLAGDLDNDVKVEAEGHYRSADGALVADKIKFKDSVRFEANLEAVGGPGASPDNVTVFGRTVFITSRTRLDIRNGSLNPTEGVRIRAFLNHDNTTFTATRIDETSNPINANDFVIQGLVISHGSPQIVVVKEIPAGFTINTAAVSAANFKDDNDNPFSTPAAFYAALKDRETVVKAKGKWDLGTNTLSAREVEIE